MAPLATTEQERFVRIPAGDVELVAVVTEPTTTPVGAALVLLSGRSGVTSVGRSRLFVGLARQLASMGYHAVRFDYRGVGESTGEELVWELDAPSLDDVAAVVAWLEGEGFADIRFIGTCGGARLALHMGALVDAAKGVAMVSPIVRNYHKSERELTLPTSELARRALRRGTLTGMLDPYTRRRYLRIFTRRLKRLRGGGAPSASKEFDWVSRNVVDDLERLVDRQVPVLVFFGSEDAGLDDWTRGTAGRLGQILERAGEGVHVDIVPGRYHALAAAVVQPALISALERWMPPAAAPEG